MKVFQSAKFEKQEKKLHKNQRLDLQKAVKDLINDPLQGQGKSGDLLGIRVYKFKMAKQLTLIAYVFDEELQTVTLVAFGSHENFYRDIKR